MSTQQKLNRFKSSLLYIIFLLVVYSCAAPKRVFYLTLYSDNMIESVSLRGTTSQSSNGSYSYYKFTEDNSIYPIFIPKEKLETAGVENIEVFNKLCYERNFKQAISFTEHINADNPDYTYYLKAIVYTLDFEFLKSNEELDKIKSSELALEKELLHLDNQYQIKKHQYDYDKSYFIQAYQDIIDNYELQEGMQKMILQRIKQFRYSK